MLATSDLHRSISKMTLDLAQAIDSRKHRADDYRLTEREIQFQYQLSGYVASAPVETTIDVPFNLLFIGDSGSQRDGDLAAPQVRSGFEIPLAPPGTIAHVHVQSWSFDQNLNYVGATVLVGVHAPALTDAEPFKLVLHIAFQGFGSLADPSGPYDAGGTNL